MPNASTRRRGAGLAAVVAVCAGLVAANGTHAAGAPTAGDPYAPELSAATFANPPMVVRQKYRWWWPGAYLDDQEIQAELKDIADHGGGGVEVAYFTPPNGGGHPQPKTPRRGGEEVAQKNKNSRPGGQGKTPPVGTA